jgi:hypothetical protein
MTGSPNTVPVSESQLHRAKSWTIHVLVVTWWFLGRYPYLSGEFIGTRGAVLDLTASPAGARGKFK